MALFHPLFVTSKKLLPLASTAIEQGPLYVIEFLEHVEPLSRKEKNTTEFVVQRPGLLGANAAGLWGPVQVTAENQEKVEAEL